MVDVVGVIPAFAAVDAALSCSSRVAHVSLLKYARLQALLVTDICTHYMYVLYVFFFSTTVLTEDAPLR